MKIANNPTQDTQTTVKAEQRLSGSSCVSTLTIAGNELFNHVHDCFAYSTQPTLMYTAGNNHRANGFVQNIYFKWL